MAGDPMKRAYFMLPARLYEIRKRCGFTQMAVELETGISKGAISMYETGTRCPTFHNLLRLAALYGVSVGWLLGETQNEHSEN